MLRPSGVSLVLAVMAVIAGVIGVVVVNTGGSHVLDAWLTGIFFGFLASFLIVWMTQQRTRKEPKQDHPRADRPLG